MISRQPNVLTEVLLKEPLKIVLSNPGNKTEPCRKIVMTRQRGYYLLERHIGRRIECEKRTLPEETAAFIESAFTPWGYRQLDAWTEERAYLLRIAKSGKMSLVTQPQTTSAASGHDRVKKYLLPEGEIIPPLVDLGVFTKDGKVAAPMGDKYHQINRYLEMIADVLPEPSGETLTVTDYGCGKSYLTFVVYYFLTAVKGLTVTMTGLDVKQTVIDTCNAAAQKYGYSGLSFLRGDITDAASYPCDRADVAISLHACDTATDYALYRAVRGGARVILAAPCCQHEFNAQMTDGGLPILTRYGVVKERAAALMTDAVRANLLGSLGYRTQLMEFVDLAHTPKNLLIRAVKTEMPPAVRASYRREADALCRQFGFTPTLAKLLDEVNV